jgi:hypothetical protein
MGKPAANRICGSFSQRACAQAGGSFLMNQRTRSILVPVGVPNSTRGWAARRHARTWHGFCGFDDVSTLEEQCECADKLLRGSHTCGVSAVRHVIAELASRRCRNSGRASLWVRRGAAARFAHNSPFLSRAALFAHFGAGVGM